MLRLVLVALGPEAFLGSGQDSKRELAEHVRVPWDVKTPVRAVDNAKIVKAKRPLDCLEVKRPVLPDLKVLPNDPTRANAPTQIRREANVNPPAVFCVSYNTT